MQPQSTSCHHCCMKTHSCCRSLYGLWLIGLRLWLFNLLACFPSLLQLRLVAKVMHFSPAADQYSYLVHAWNMHPPCGIYAIIQNYLDHLCRKISRLQILHKVYCIISLLSLFHHIINYPWKQPHHTTHYSLHFIIRTVVIHNTVISPVM